MKQATRELIESFAYRRQFHPRERRGIWPGRGGRSWQADKLRESRATVGRQYTADAERQTRLWRRWRAAIDQLPIGDPLQWAESPATPDGFRKLADELEAAAYDPAAITPFRRVADIFARASLTS